MERPESPDPLTPRPLPVEILAMWLLFVFVGGEILVTYTRTPAAELYYVTGSGFGLAVHTALLFVVSLWV